MDILEARKVAAAAEIRGEVPAGSVPVSASNFFEIITGMGGNASASGISVTTENALGVPAVWAAVNFLEIGRAHV